MEKTNPRKEATLPQKISAMIISFVFTVPMVIVIHDFKPGKFLGVLMTFLIMNTIYVVAADSMAANTHRSPD